MNGLPLLIWGRKYEVLKSTSHDIIEQYSHKTFSPKTTVISLGPLLSNYLQNSSLIATFQIVLLFAKECNCINMV